MQPGTGLVGMGCYNGTMDVREQAGSPSACDVAPLPTGAQRRHAWMRWITLLAITVGLAFTLQPGALLPGVPLLACLLAAYVGLVTFQYSGRIHGRTAALGMPAPAYLLLCTLLIFAMIVAAADATNGESMWYSVAYFIVLGEGGRYLPTARALAALTATCVALIILAALIIVPAHSWPSVFFQLFPLFAGLTASAIGSRTERAREVEHAARLALLRELERSKADVEEANHQLQVYAGMVEQLAVANERTRMARELHDILGYTLATVVVKAEAAKRLLAADPARALGEMDRVQEVARGGLAEVRRSVAGLRDAATVPGVWHQAMARFVEEFGQQAGLIVRQHIDPLPDGHATDLEMCLFRVIQEALTNVARHAQARHVSITLEVRADTIELAIEDDGVGAGPAASPSGGFGLRGMRERVELLGGHLVFSSRRGDGARVVATLPLAQGSNSPLAGEGSYPLQDGAVPAGAAQQGMDVAYTDEPAAQDSRALPSATQPLPNAPVARAEGG
jgi:signal transduction histidine kinase